MLFASPLDRFLLAHGEAAELPILLRRVMQLGMDAWVPHEIDVETILEIKTVVFLFHPHPEPMRIEQHDLRLLAALLLDIAVQQVSKMLRDLIPELEAHADVGNATEKRFEHRFGLIAVAIGREVRENASKFIAGDICPIGSHHHIVASGKVSQWQQLAYGGSLEFLLVLRVGHRHGANPPAPTSAR